MKVTLQIDAMGSLHIWKGHSTPVRTDKYLYEVEGREADYFFQSRDEYMLLFGPWIENDLPALDSGWFVMAHFPNDLLEV